MAGHQTKKKSLLRALRAWEPQTPHQAPGRARQALR
jgi:hypothetical protein